MNKKAIIIVAGGKGTRMNSLLPKQYICLGNKPILMHTISRFYEIDATFKLIVVLPFEDHQFWKELCENHNFTIQHELAKGGETRFESVKNGLACLDSQEWVAIHDGVRPFI